MKTITLQQLQAALSNAGLALGSLNPVPPSVRLGAFPKIDTREYFDARDAAKREKQALSFEDWLAQHPKNRTEDEATGLDAFERQLNAHGIIVRGMNAVSLDQFYTDPSSNVLFPNFVNRNIQIGRLLGKWRVMLPDLVSRTIGIDSGVYQATVADMTGDFSRFPVGEKGEFPRIDLTTADKTISLFKRGFKVEASYEFLSRLRADKIGALMQLVGQQLERDEVADCLDVIVNGNTGNSNSATSYALTTFNYDNFYSFLAELTDYPPDVFITDKAGWKAVGTDADLKQHSVGNTMKETGTPLNPFGTPVKMALDNGATFTNKILAVYRPMTVEHIVENGASLVEFDTIINRQFREIVVSDTFGFAREIADAATVWDYS